MAVEPPHPARNRVTPLGEIVAIEQRGLFMGNRGCIHRDREIVRQWQVRRWICCELQHKGWVAPKWVPGRWTALFFWDEAVALAAGHRPCALCRRADFNSWMDAWESAFGDRPKVDAMDRRMQADRREGAHQRRHQRAWSDLPVGSFVALNSAGSNETAERHAETPAVVLPDCIVPWSPAGYGTPLDRPNCGHATVLTPRCSVEVLERGYEPVIHPIDA